MNAAAIPAVTQNATAGLKKSIKIIRTKIIPDTALLPISSIRLSNISDPSNHIEKVRSGGNLVLISSSNFRIDLPASVTFILSGDWT